MKDLIIILGNKNSSEGVLSECIKMRATCAIDLFKKHPSASIITTGSFGDGFNTTHVPHGLIVNEFLKQNGVDAKAIVGHTHSTNTIEDALAIRRFLIGHPNYKRLQIVTSPFHMQRVKFIFSRIFQFHELVFAESSQPKEMESEEILQGEARKLKLIKRDWVDVANIDFEYKEAAAQYSVLQSELAHYDNLSYFTIAGGVAIFYFAFAQKFVFDSNVHRFISYSLAAIAILLMNTLYLRLATTANASRRVMIAMEKIFGLPGISSAHAARTQRVGWFSEVSYKLFGTAIYDLMQIKNIVRVFLSFLALAVLAKGLEGLQFFAKIIGKIVPQVN